MKRTSQGFTLIELVVIVVVIGIIAVVALPRFLSYSTEARIALLEALEGNANEVVRNVQAIRNIPGREFESSGNTFVTYSNGVDLRLKKEQLDIWGLCRGMGLTNTTLSSSVKRVTSFDGRYQCYSENAQSMRIIDLQVEDDSCYLQINSNNHNSEPSFAVNCG